MLDFPSPQIELAHRDVLQYFDWKYCIPKSSDFDNEAYYPLYYSDKRYNLIRGGRGSAKSYEVCGKLPIVLISSLPFCRFLIVRQIYQTHKTSTYQEILDYLDFWQLKSEFQINKSPMSIVHKETGNYILFRGMDKPDAIKSVKDITHVVWEEAFEIKDWQGITVVDKSVRTPKLKFGGIHKHYFPFNPDNINHPLYEVFYDESEEKKRRYKPYRDNALLLHTTYKDNKFVPQTFINLIEADRIANPERFLVDGLGQWGMIRETGLFYRHFDYVKNVEEGLYDRVYDSRAPLHITFDFNVYPYISLAISQLHYDEIEHELQACTIDEICLDDNASAGDLRKTVEAFLKKYRRHTGKVIVCGDRAGHSRKTNSIPDFATIFNMMQKTPTSQYQQQRTNKGTIEKFNPYPEYEELGCSFVVVDNTIRDKNPRLILRQNFFERLHLGKLKVLPLSPAYGTINAKGQKRAMSQQYENIRIVQKIDALCKKTIKDYMELKEDVTKGGKCTRNKDLGHISDALDYQYCKWFAEELAFIAKELKL